MQNDKLLPCPFCGGEAIQETGERIVWYDESEEFECVHCTNCKASVEGKTVEEVIKAWNTRKPMERIAERLEEMFKYHSATKTVQRLVLETVKDWWCR